MEPVHEPLAFHQEGVVDIVAAAEHGFAVGHTLGQNHIGGVQGLQCFLSQQIDLGAGNPVAVVDDRERNAHGGSICPGGIVEDHVTPDTEENFQMGIFLCDFLGKNPVKADFSGVIRQIQQLFAALQFFAELPVHILIQLEVEGGIQHLIQFLKAYLALKGGKIQIVAQNGKLQTRKHRIFCRFHLLPDQIQALQNEPVGQLLFLLHPVQGQTVMLQHQIRGLGIEPGRGNAFGRFQIQAHQILSKGHGLGFRAQRFDGFQISPEVAQKTLGINGETHYFTFSFTTTFTKSLGTSR